MEYLSSPERQTDSSVKRVEPAPLTRYSALEFGFLFGIGFVLGAGIIGSVLALLAVRVVLGH